MTAYRSAHALEMAVKDAAKNSAIDTGRAVSGFYFHRLLCRIFADGNESFVLKGGQGMLARTIDARATRDIDLLSMRNDLESALADMKRLAQKDLDDFVSFEFIDARPIKVDDEYRLILSRYFRHFLCTSFWTDGLQIDAYASLKARKNCITKWYDTI